MGRIHLFLWFTLVFTTLISLNYNTVSPKSRLSISEKARALIFFKPYLALYKFQWKRFLLQAPCSLAKFLCDFAMRMCAWNGCPVPASPGPVTVTSPTTTTAVPTTTTPGATILKPEYMIVKDQLNWMEAHINCNLEGYNLTTVEDSQEFNHLQMVIANSQPPMLEYFWTAGNDLFREGSFSWISNGANFTDFFPPGNIEPTAFPDEDCVFLYYTSTFNLYAMADFPCDFKAASICKKFVPVPL